jgi:hypothetical protein
VAFSSELTELTELTGEDGSVDSGGRSVRGGRAVVGALLAAVRCPPLDLAASAVATAVATSMTAPRQTSTRRRERLPSVTDTSTSIGCGV